MGHGDHLWHGCWRAKWLLIAGKRLEEICWRGGDCRKVLWKQQIMNLRILQNLNHQIRCFCITSSECQKKEGELPVKSYWALVKTPQWSGPPQVRLQNPGTPDFLAARVKTHLHCPHLLLVPLEFWGTASDHLPNGHKGQCIIIHTRPILA